MNIIRPKIQTEDLLLSITKNCETIIEQTHRKSEETLEFRLQKSKKVFHFNPPIRNKGDWMVGLTSLEVYNRFFIITEENNKFEQRLERKLNDVNSFNNHINKITEMIQYFRGKNNKSKKRYKNYRTLNTVLESLDSIIIIGRTSTSITLSITGIGLVVLPSSAGIACTLSLGNNVLHKLIINKYNKYKKHYERDQITIKSSDKLYRKSLQDNAIEKNENESLCNIFTKHGDETKNECFFYIYEQKKIKFL